MIYILLFLSPTNWYYILVKFEHSNFIIFFNIVDFVFLTPSSFILGPFFAISDVLEQSPDFRRVYIWLLMSLTNLCYVLVKLDNFNFTILFNIFDFCFWSIFHDLKYMLIYDVTIVTSCGHPFQATHVFFGVILNSHTIKHHIGYLPVRFEKTTK